MHAWFRRFLVLIALMFWQGGFTFYSSVVVPLGQETFGPIDQGFLTRQVTNYLNLSGVIAIAILASEMWFSRDVSLARRAARWGLLAATALLLAVLIWLHARLDAFLDLENMQLLDRRSFRTEHRVYLWVSTIQWACCVGLTLLAVISWRAEDRRDTGEVTGA
jgi:hypothetical protein